MNRIDKTFKELKDNRKKAFIAYITAGDPTLSMTYRIALAMEKAGVDIIELGIPFSDPLADGPTIQAASQRALKKGANLKKIFKLVKDLRKVTPIPLVFMTYYNPVLRYGLDDFARDCKNSGVDGVIVPDLPAEEAAAFTKAANRSKVAPIFLAAPTSTRERIRRIAASSKGFIYYVSLTGVTGARRKLPPEAAAKIRTIKSVTDKPVCVGFGVSTPEQAESLARVCDGVIVGSAIVRLIEKKGDLVRNVFNFSRRLAEAVHGS